MFKKIRDWFVRSLCSEEKIRYREGVTISRFIARDVRRDVLVVSVARLDEGIIVARVRTTNLLYVSKGLALAPEFGPETEFKISELWRWTGKDWGGLPDGTSIVDHFRGEHNS